MLGIVTGAYVPVVGIAASAPDFRLRIVRVMNALDFQVIVLEDVRQLGSTSDVDALDEVLRDRLSTLHKGNPVEFGGFHSFQESNGARRAKGPGREEASGTN